MQSPSWKANRFAASQAIPRISRHPKVRYRIHKSPPPVSTLGQPNPVNIPSSHLLEIHRNIIHPTTPRSPHWSLSLRFPHQDPIHPALLTYTRHMPSSSHLLDFITRTILGEEYKSLSSSLCSLLHSPVTSSLLRPNILLNTMFSNTLSFLSSRNANDQVSHLYKTRGKIIVLYILIFKFLDRNLEDKRFCIEWQQTFPDLNLLLISSAIEFWFVKVVPKYLNSSTPSIALCKEISIKKCEGVFSLTYPACNAHSSYYIVYWGLAGSTVDFHVIT